MLCCYSISLNFLFFLFPIASTLSPTGTRSIGTIKSFSSVGHFNDNLYSYTSGPGSIFGGNATSNPLLETAGYVSMLPPPSLIDSHHLISHLRFLFLCSYSTLVYQEGNQRVALFLHPNSNSVWTC